MSGEINTESVLTKANSISRLEQFKGDSSQKIESYLRRFDQYKMCTGINDQQVLATLTWHLGRVARKPALGMSDKAGFKQISSATETS